MKQEYWITPLDKPGMLEALMVALAGNSEIALEGDLSDCDFSVISHYSIAESGELHRVNDESQTDYKVFQLNHIVIQSILSQIICGDRLAKKIEHIQIQKNGQLQVLIGDYFHDECISVGPLVSVEILDSLTEKGLIKGDQSDAEVKVRYPWLKA